MSMGCALEKLAPNSEVGNMTLLVDHREHPQMKNLIKDYIHKHAPDSSKKVSLDKIGDLDFPENVKFVQLDVGDYADPQNGFAVERKSDDLWPEIDNGNLFAKLQELSQYPHAYLIIDKTLEEVKRDIRKRVFMKKRMTGGEKQAEIARRMLRLNGAIASCCIRGFPPIFAGDKKSAAQLIVRLYYKAQDKKDRSMVTATRPTATHKDRMMRVLLSYPDVGDKTATKLLEHYGTIEKVNEGLKELFAKPDKALMRELGLNKRQLEHGVAILVGGTE